MASQHNGESGENNIMLDNSYIILLF